MIDCRSCFGVGKLADYPFGNCADCDGRGDTGERMQCPDCNGTGKFQLEPSEGSQSNGSGNQTKSKVNG